MALRLLEIYLDAGHADTLKAVCEQHGAIDCYLGAISEDGRLTARILVSPGSQQAVLDAVQAALSGSQGWRIVMLPVEAALPEPDKSDEKPLLPASKMATREEIAQDMKAGIRLDRGFIVLALLSTIVAAIGLLTNSVAVVIGAMVIAPLLGPNLAFAFASAMGDRPLRSLALRTNAVGVMIALVVSAIVGAAWQGPLNSEELMSRTVVGYGGIALALAAGAAAVLSLTTGVSSALVGVMVAVALLPPAVTIGMMLGVGNWEKAAGAALLLAVNVVCVNLSAQIVFIARGLGPRTWFEKRESRLLVWRNIIVWSLLLAAISVVIWIYNSDYALIDSDSLKAPPIGAPKLP
ncbi:MAG: TIGR00341 family protein [Proteobacteria bacterium]|nr:TIGR00341 family protein [Pseudomonadota bacterium]